LQCSFLPRFSIRIRTKYYNDNGSIENVCILRAFAHFISHIISEMGIANSNNGCTVHEMYKTKLYLETGHSLKNVYWQPPNIL